MVKAISGHKFDEWTWGLTQKPPVLEKWQIAEILSDIDEGPYREAYRRHDIRDNGEPLVSCSSYGLVSKDYYLNKLADGEMSFFPALKEHLFFPVAWVRKTVAESLRLVDDELRKHDLFIVINSGWRHPDVQRLAIEWSKKNRGEEVTRRRYANVDANKKKVIVPHQTGGAVDLELWSAQTNKPLTRMEGRNDEVSFFRFEENVNLTENDLNKRKVRRILYHTLTTEGIILPKERLFLIHPGEYWHFGFGDPLTAYFRHEPYAIYGPTQPPKDYDMYKY